MKKLCIGRDSHARNKNVSHWEEKGRKLQCQGLASENLEDAEE